MQDRRRFFRNVFGAGLGLGAAQLNARPGSAVLVQTPDIPDLPHTLDNGVKVFHLIAEPVKRQIAPNKKIDVWGYNGTCPGPTIQITQGDRVRIVFENRLPEPTSMHWHGFEIPNAMDGGPNISQRPVNPGERFVYEFTLHQEGTYFYHSHMAMQEMMGMLGAFIMHPKTPYEPRVDKDFVLMLQEFAVLPSNTVPNTMNMEFNWLLFNGKAGPTITPLIVRLGDRVRIRFINLGMDHHPIHLHGHTFYVTGTEGGRIPNTAWIPGNTVLVGVAQARDIEFAANNPGDWMLHCHLPHHMMNQMSSNVGPMTRMGAGSDRIVVNGPLSSQHASMPGMQMQTSGISPNAKQVPGFPQDAFMEGPMMNMDNMVQGPATYGLPPGWTEDMQGMMTLVRVLHPDKYDEIMNRIRRGDMPSMQHPM